jgi:hypothetical protein
MIETCLCIYLDTYKEPDWTTKLKEVFMELTKVQILTKWHVYIVYLKSAKLICVTIEHSNMNVYVLFSACILLPMTTGNTSNW